MAPARFELPKRSGAGFSAVEKPAPDRMCAVLPWDQGTVNPPLFDRLPMMRKVLDAGWLYW
jgi:hypothetical protein